MIDKYKNFLDDDFSLSGKKQDSLIEALHYMAGHTDCILIEPANLHLFSIIGVRKNGLEIAIMKPDYMDIRLLAPENGNQLYFSKQNKNIGLLPFENFYNEGITKEQLDDVINSGFFLQYRSGTEIFTIIPSKAFFAPYCRRLDISKLNTGIDPIRDLYLASRMRSAPAFQMIYRKKNGIGKAFGCFSSKFNYMPASTGLEIMQILEEMAGPIAVKEWNITHFLTKIEVIFPQTKEDYEGAVVYGGVRLEFSDTGDSSYILRNFISIDNGIVLMDIAETQKHTKDLDFRSFVEKYVKRKYPKLESALYFLKKSEEDQIPDIRSASQKAIGKLRQECFGKKNYNKFFATYPQLERAQGKASAVLCHLLKVPGFLKAQVPQYVYESVSQATGKILLQYYEGGKY